MIGPCLYDIINNHRNPKNLKVQSSDEVIDYETQFVEWKIQLIMLIIFISSNDSDQTHNICIYIYIYTYKECDNIEIMMGSETYDIIAELFESLLQKYQKG